MASSPGDEKRTNYESVDHCTNPSSRLPAKSLPRRRSLRPFAISAFAAFFLILSMIILIHFLPNFEPDYGSSFQWVGQDQSLSCDLTTPTDSRLENAFMINLRSGQHLTFSQAKFVDVIWDLFVGQRGRLLMAWAAYRVFMDGLVSLMEKTAVTHDIYASLVYDTTSLLSTWKAMKAVLRSKDWRSRAFMLWFCLSTIYILAFPTLMSAATGYVVPSTAGYRMPDGSFVMPDSAKLTSFYTLPNGAQIGEKNGTIINGPQALVDCNWNSSLCDSYPDYYTLLTYSPTRVYANDTPPPSYQSDPEYFQNYTTNITWHGHTYIFHNQSNLWFDDDTCYEGKPLLMDIEDKENRQCISNPYFVWGFSSLLLRVILYIQIAWTFTMFFIWIHANMTSQLLFKNRRVRGGFRATADLAEAMEDVLGDEFCAYSEAEIARELNRDTRGLRYYTLEKRDKGISHIGIGGHSGLGLDNSRLYGGRRRRKNNV